MTALILLCFGAADPTVLDDREFFAGTTCLTWHLRCERELREHYNYVRSDTARVCTTAWQEARREGTEW